MPRPDWIDVVNDMRNAGIPVTRKQAEFLAVLADGRIHSFEGIYQGMYGLEAGGGPIDPAQVARTMVAQLRQRGVPGIRNHQGIGYSWEHAGQYIKTEKAPECPASTSPATS